MLFPLMIGVAVGVALERYYLAEENAECKAKEKKKDEPKAKDEEKEANESVPLWILSTKPSKCIRLWFRAAQLPRNL